MRTALAAAALAALVVSCATPTPTPSASAAPAAPSALSPTPVAAPRLVVAGTIRQSCGSIGGCAYFIAIDGPRESWRAELVRGVPDVELVSAELLPGTIPEGSYRLTLSSVVASDMVTNGVRELGPVDATCSTTLIVRRDQPVRIQGLFDKGSCNVEVKA